MNPARIRQTTRPAQGGFLIVEAMIAVVIFSIGLLGLVGLQAKAMQFSVDAEDRNRAALLANEIVSEMWGQQTVDADDLSAEIATWKKRVKAALPPHDDTVTASVSAADTEGVVTITIAWRPPTIRQAAGRTYVTQIAMP